MSVGEVEERREGEENRPPVSDGVGALSILRRLVLAALSIVLPIGTAWRLTEQVDGFAPTIVVLGACGCLAAGCLYSLRVCARKRVAGYDKPSAQHWLRWEARLAKNIVAGSAVVLGVSISGLVAPAYVASAAVAAGGILLLCQFLVGGHFATVEKDLTLKTGISTVEAHPWVKFVVIASDSMGVTQRCVRWLLNPRYDAPALSVHLRRIMGAGAIALATLAVVPMAEVVQALERAGGPGESTAGQSAPGSTPGGGQAGSSPPPTRSPRTYAQLCPSLPDPLAIQHGLGHLFRHHGAVQAGCGEQAMQVDESSGVWVAPGMCGNELRSLAVVSPGRPPVLIYGGAARLVSNHARARDLRYVEWTKVDGGGEVAVVGTSAGSFVLTQRESATSGRSHAAESCGEVEVMAKKSTVLTPTMSDAWRQFVTRHGWVWPDQQAGQELIMREGGGVVVAVAACRPSGACFVDGESGYVESSEIAHLTLGDLEPFMPNSP